MHLLWHMATIDAESGECSGRFANIPLYRVQTIAAIADMRAANILAGGQYILYPLRHKCTQRNLKGQRRYVDIIIAARARMQMTT